MKRLSSRPLLLLITLSLTACSKEAEAPQEPSPAPRAEPLKEAPRSEPQDETPSSIKRRTMSETERKAIAEARSRRLPVTQSLTSSPTKYGDKARVDNEDGSTLVGARAEEAKDTGLTPFEKQAALDDPAAKLPSSSDVAPLQEAEQDEVQAAPPPKRLSQGPRPGVELGSASDGLKLLDLAIATEVKKREPSGINATFATMPKRFHCFCVFENRNAPTQVTHVWKRDGRIVSRVELEVGKSPKWRTWSRQRLKASWTGEWTCQVETKAGRTLGLAKVQAGR